MTTRAQQPHESEAQPSFSLATVELTTIAQFRHDPPSLVAGLRELAKHNFELSVRLRIEATRKFPDDLAARQQALSLAVMALGLVESQGIKDALMDQYSAIPASLAAPPVTVMPPAA